MSVLVTDGDSNVVQASMLPVSGSTITLVAGVSSVPLVGGIYRFNAVATGAIALGGAVVAGDMDLIAGVPENFGIPNGAVITANVSVKATLT